MAEFQSVSDRDDICIKSHHIPYWPHKKHKLHEDIGHINYINLSCMLARANSRVVGRLVNKSASYKLCLGQVIR